MDKVGYGRRTDGRVWVDGWSRRFVYYGMDGLFIDGYGWISGMGGMCTEMGSSIVMYNFGVGHGGPYKSANLEGHQSNLLLWGSG
jgi:hypothetical protein